MLSPEVWNFREPACSFKQEIGDFNKTDCPAAVNSIPCNHLVTVVVPETLKVPEELANALVTDCEYYKVEKLPLNELVDRQFLDNFVRKGQLTALSVDSRIDCDDCVLLTADGVLVLSLVKDTYLRLGVEGKKSRYHEKTRARYIIKINLKTCKPGKIYDRIKQRLSLIKTTLLIKWHPANDNICPSSIAKYFHDRGFPVKECNSTFTSRTEYSVKVPQVDFDGTIEGEEFVEWLGMLSLGCELGSESPDDFINTYETPKPNIDVGQVKILQWRGFFSVEELQRLFDCIRKYVKQEEKMWLALYVQGFSDCPLSWGDREQNYFTNGDNGYIVVLKENKYLLFKQIC